VNEDSTSLLSNGTTLATIRNFLASEKPASITPLDILQMVHFMTCKAEDHDTYYAQQTLARMFNTDPRSVARSQQRLASPEIDWIARPQRRGRANAVSIKYQNVPAEEILRLKITPEAQQLALRYQTALRKCGRKKFPAQWLRQQFPSAQRIINDCGGDVELAARKIGHALGDPRHRKKAMLGLYHVYGRWRKIEESFDASQQQRQQTESTAQTAPQTAQTEVA
jgi:hypothetical protein